MGNRILIAIGIGLVLAFGFLVHLFGAQFGDSFPFFLERQYPGFISHESWLVVVSNPERYDAYSGYNVLEERGSDIAVPVATKHIHSSDPYLRLNAATYLGSQGDVSAVPFLIKGLRHKASRSVVERAEMLSELTGKSFGTDFFAWRDWYIESEDPLQMDWTSSLGHKVVDSWNPNSEQAEALKP